LRLTFEERQSVGSHGNNIVFQFPSLRLLHNLFRFVETLQRRSSEAAEMVVQMYTANRMQLSRCFDRELTALPPETRERTLNALAMALAPESWVVLRQRLGLTVEQARDELRFVTRAVFTYGAARG